MAIAATDVDICNLALDRLGVKPITALSPTGTTEQRICERWYATTRRELLRRYIFNFAKKFAVLTKNALTPAFGYSTAYDLPADFIRLMALGDVTINADTPTSLYTLSENDIFTDHEDDTDKINILYIKDALAVLEYDALFVKLLSLFLASNMAYKFTLKVALVANIEKLKADTETAAAAIAGQEKPPRRIQRSKFRDRRRFGSINFDNTRIF